MSEIDKISGLPKELFDLTEIKKETQKIKVRISRRRFGKYVTTISGINDQKQLQELLKELKRKLACGGTAKDDVIELQGDHKENVKDVLIKQGYKEELIDV